MIREPKQARPIHPGSGTARPPGLSDRAVRAWRSIRAKVCRIVRGTVEEIIFFLDPGAPLPSAAEERQYRAAAAALEECLGRNAARTLVELHPEERDWALAELHAVLAQALGLSPATVSTEPLSCHGAFLAKDQVIVLNSAAVEQQPMTESDAWLLLTTVCHETYHAFQLAACRRPSRYGVSKSDARIWRINFRDYITSEENPERYWIQPLETTARLFATRVIQTLREGDASL